MKELIEKTRTVRRFHNDQKIKRSLLEELIDLARLGGSARNCQPWQYLIVTDDETCAQIFPHLGWAGYLTDWKGPEKHEQPSAYILCYLNTQWLKGSTTEAHFDLGICSQNLLLGATQKGIGGCRIAAFSPKLSSVFSLEPHLELGLVIALGIPAEEIQIEKCTNEDIKYWKDSEGIHHVPKRSLVDILLTIDNTSPS